ncbi:hypothetical protein N0V92_003026 [Colletotrichum tropicale]|nr:hypothetical protein N0V92_003026 [Colletotrichum tropicale]
MTSLKYDQFVAFGSDSAGLERILRGLQSLTAILTTYPFLLALLPSAGLSLDPAPILAALGPLKGHLNLTRRFIRFFWFLNSFGASYNLYTAAPSQAAGAGKGAEVWLDILRFTLLGLYGGLESLTLPDLLGVPGLAPFGAARTKALNVEAQRFWFLALACGIAANVVRMTKAFAYAPVPQHGEGYGTGQSPAVDTDNLGAKEKKEGEGEEPEKMDLNAERQRLKALVVKRREGMRRWRRQVAFKVKTLGRKVVSDTLDCLIPGVILGWM